MPLLTQFYLISVLALNSCSCFLQMSWSSCEENSDSSNSEECLEINYGSLKDVALLAEVSNGNLCIWEGYLRNEGAS